MGVSWTDEQQLVIDSRRHNLLVSAAAGSGKTAVLVERILQMVTDPVHPVDIDRLLIVTFTRAAAGEMRERIGKALEKRLEENPEDEHLQQQGVLLHHAQITTIDGFCTYVIQNYFHQIGIDPGYRIMEDGEERLLRAAVLEEMLEEEYTRAAEEAGSVSGDSDVSGFSEEAVSGSGDSGTSSLSEEALFGNANDPEAEGTEAFLQNGSPEEKKTGKPGGIRFTDFVDAYANGRNDRKLEEMILRIYTFAMSDPYPDAWLERCIDNFRIGSGEELLQTSWMREITADMRLRVKEAAANARKLVQRAEETDGCEICVPVLQGDLEQLEQLAQLQEYDELQRGIEAISWAKWKGTAAGEKKQFSPEELTRIKAERDKLKNVRDKQIKPAVDALSKDPAYSMDPESICEEMTELLPYMQELVRLVRHFRDAFADAKRKKNLADFSDLEHYALEILVTREEDGTLVRTEAAKELAQRFEEVMIDEYQDSNYLQEAILTAVSRNADGEYNRFMVGDMKQSIYGFRMARPDLFLEKHDSYANITRKEMREAAESAKEIRIDLSRNFRSRKEVLASVNAFFARLMIPEVGGITYDDAAALHPGADYPDAEDPDMPKTELLLLNKEDEGFDEDRSRAAMEEAEALMIAGRIRELKRTGKVWDRAADAWRPLEYRDCVILLRSASTAADTYTKVLQAEGIPANATSRTGYFSALEVVTVLNMLRILDNPMQDIPFTAVLRSPIVGLTDKELAEIRIAGEKLPMYRAAAAYAEKYAGEGGGKRAEEGAEAEVEAGAGADAGKGENAGDPVLAGKLQSFFAVCEELRSCAVYTPVHALIEMILQKTGYGSYAAAMPAGAKRAANLEMLKEKAIAYEKTSYHGLFNFIRYIELLEKYEVDYGEVNLFGEEENIVRIMTIHKSKGLEFPVVFAAGLGKQFNKMDQRNATAMHAALGIGIEKIDLERRTRKSTFYQKAIQKRIERDNYSEELRVLYVALTRAKEKLILTGTVGKEEKIAEAQSLQEVQGESLIPLEPLSYARIMAARSFLDWILEALPGRALTALRVIDAEALAKDTMQESMRQGEILADLLQPSAGLTEQTGCVASEIREFLEKQESFVYPHSRAAELPAKMTVSEIKKASMEAQEEEIGERLYPEETLVPYVPSFIEEKNEDLAGGAARGTIYHHVFACLEYAVLPKLSQEKEEKETAAELRAAVSREIDRMKKRGLLKPAEDRCLKKSDFVRFLRSDIGKRMKAAADAGKLRREQPFVIDISAKDIDSSWPEGENILVQGTIDAYFEENGSYVIVDYKTDRVQTADGSDLAALYKKQLQYYRLALQRITGRTVSEMWIYSVRLGKSIRIEEEEA
ncbi:MAG: helicase-exonuclease AddAB subunit AddA [Eubacteriales bacterium]|nr:helicase-exonuclease AddAB subunit AddA [Eubacteriales bacterium]